MVLAGPLFARNKPARSHQVQSRLSGPAYRQRAGFRVLELVNDGLAIPTIDLSEDPIDIILALFAIRQRVDAKLAAQRSIPISSWRLVTNSNLSPNSPKRKNSTRHLIKVHSLGVKSRSKTDQAELRSPVYLLVNS